MPTMLQAVGVEAEMELANAGLHQLCAFGGCDRTLHPRAQRESDDSIRDSAGADAPIWGEVAR